MYQLYGLYHSQVRYLFFITLICVIVGMYEYSRTGQLLPILIGTDMEDPSGSAQQVPVLGVEKEKSTGKVGILITCMESL